MATQTVVKPDKIKTLAEFVARVGKAANLGFDPETREATIYTDAAHTVKVKSIPWKREVDTLTVLSQPHRFSALAVSTASSRLVKLKEQQALRTVTGDESLRVAEAAILNAWRSYRAADPAIQPSLRRDILSAEAAYDAVQKSLIDKNRVIREFKKPQYRNGGTGLYIPPMPSELRGISLVEAPAASAASAAGGSGDSDTGDSE